jgi:hypothetical protein
MRERLRHVEGCAWKIVLDAARVCAGSWLKLGRSLIVY